MKKEEINQVFGDVQKQLDTLQGSGASFMFIGHEGNHFVLGGNLINISAQIVFAMIRYPVVRDIIKACAKQFDSLNDKYSEDVKQVKMDHLIELNSGN